MSRYREEAPGIDAQTAHGSRARTFGRIGSDIERLEARTAADVPYTPANAGDWNTPLPTNVADALDRLAVGGGPPW